MRDLLRRDVLALRPAAVGGSGRFADVIAEESDPTNRI
jgi:hypothetical protein